MQTGRNVNIFKFKIFAEYLGLSAVTSFLPLYYESIGFSNTQIGILFSILFFLGGILMPCYDKIARDPIKTQRAFPYIMYVGSICCVLILLFSKSFASAVVMALIYSQSKGFGYSMQENEIMLFSESSKIEYSKLRIFGTVAFVVLTLFGGYIIKYFGFSTLFLIAISSYSICFIISKTSALIEISKMGDEENEREASSGVGVAKLLKNKKFLLFLFGQMTIISMISALDSFAPLYYSSRNISIETIGFISAVNLCFEFFGFLIFGKLDGIKGYMGQIIVGTFVVSRCVGYVCNVSIFGIFILAGVQGICNSASILFTMRYINLIVGIEDVGSGYLASLMISSIFSGIINAVGGVLIDSFSFGKTFSIIAIIVACSMTIVIVGICTLYRTQKKVES